MGHATRSQSQIMQALFVQVDVIVLNHTINSARVLLMSALTVCQKKIVIDCQNLFKLFRAFLQQGFLFLKSPFLPSPLLPQADFFLKNPIYFFHFPANMKNY